MSEVNAWAAMQHSMDYRPSTSMAATTKVLQAVFDYTDAAWNERWAKLTPEQQERYIEVMRKMMRE